MSEQLPAAAAAVGAPADLVERSARARAAAQGTNYEDILAAWAGGDPVPAGSAPTPDAEPAPVAPPESPTTTATPEPTPAEAPEEVAVTATETAGSALAAGVLVGAPAAPATVSQREAGRYEAVTTVATVGIKERTTTVTPKWLSALFVGLPVAAIIYFISFSTGPNCGVGGQLAVDRQTGAVENCDGSEYQAGGAVEGIDARAVIAAGSQIYSGPSANCATCHGANGGGASGPQLAGGAVVTTFGACVDHIEWVSLGSAGFQNAGRTSYGDSAKPVNGGMPGFGSGLSPEEIASVVLFERVNFGGSDAEAALVDCGFVEGGSAEGADVEALG